MIAATTWYLTRGSGAVALILLTVAGVVLSFIQVTRIMLGGR